MPSSGGPWKRPLVRHPTRGIWPQWITHLEVLNDEHLGNNEEKEPANDNEEVPSPQVVDIQRKAGLDVVRPTDDARSWLSAVESAGLVGSDDVRVLVHSRAVTRNNVRALANQRNPRKLIFHEARPGVGERVDVVDPEQPPLHQVLGNEVSGVLNDVGEEDDGHTEGGVEILEAETKGTEETLHGEEGCIADEMECPEATC